MVTIPILVMGFLHAYFVIGTATEVVGEASDTLTSSKKFLGLMGQCGSWNDLADIDCTATPILNVHYTMDMHNLKMRILSGEISNKKKSLAGKNIESAVTVYSPQPLGASLRGPATSALTLPTWTNIPAGQGPSSTGGITYSAEVNTGDYVITSASGGTVLTFSACGSAESTCGTGSSGDTYFRLVSTLTGKQLAFDDDSCGSYGSCSLLTYTVPGSASNYPSMTFKIGCFFTSTCSATVTITGISSLTSSAPTMAPSAAPVANPSIAPSQYPVQAPSAAPTTLTQRSFSNAYVGYYLAEYATGPSSSIFFSTLTAAQTACRANPTCNGITKEPTNNNRHTLRKGTTLLVSPTGETSWLYQSSPGGPANPTPGPTQRPVTTPNLSPTLSPVPAVSPPSFAPASGTLSYNLVRHGGPINKAPVVKLIFWGSSWATAPGDKIYGMDLFYKGWTGSSYSKISTQYSGPNGPVSGSISYGGYVIDSSTPTTATDTGTILSEVCARIPNPDAAGNGYYVVYTERPRGAAGYCGWHSYGYCGTVLVQFAFLFNMDNDSGCGGTTSASLIPDNAGAGWTMNAGKMSAGAHALAGVSAHELTEMITDPRLDAWYDSTGAENADKCAWTFPPSNTLFANGITWRIQGDWSNAAALAGTGYQTFSSAYGVNVKGCVGSP